MSGLNAFLLIFFGLLLLYLGVTGRYKCLVQLGQCLTLQQQTV